MFTKLALCERLNQKTVSQLHRYLTEFGRGAHRTFWNGGRAFVELEDLADAALVRDQFPGMVRAELRQNPHDFPWQSASIPAD